MKEKVLFITGLIGSFSATIILLITNGLVILGVDTSGYVNIINIVGIILAVLILIGSAIFLNKYSVIQHNQTINQNNLVTSALSGNATLMQTVLPELANSILSAAEERSAALLKTAETNINSMMNEMLPALAEQTMALVTKQSQDIVNSTTAKANETMQRMDELLPTYAKNISDSVAHTVRENNAHYHKMLTEVKALFVDVCARPIAEVTTTKALAQLSTDLQTLLSSTLDTTKLNNQIQMTIETAFANLITKSQQAEVAETYPEVAETYPEVAETYPEVAETYPEVAETYPEVAETYPDADMAEEVNTQSDELIEESDESSTL